MIYQFDSFGRIMAAHETFIEAAAWINKHTGDLNVSGTGGLITAAERIADCCYQNDELLCLREQVFGFYYSGWSFLGDL